VKLSLEYGSRLDHKAGRVNFPGYDCARPDFDALGGTNYTVEPTCHNDIACIDLAFNGGIVAQD